jgi:hypothetical protein
VIRSATDLVRRRGTEDRAIGFALPNAGLRRRPYASHSYIRSEDVIVLVSGTLDRARLSTENRNLPSVQDHQPGTYPCQSRTSDS